MDNTEIGQAFCLVGKQDSPLDVMGLTTLQISYSKAVYGHLCSLTENFRKAPKIVRLVRGDNGFDVWNRLVHRFDPQNPEVHAAQVEHIVTFGSRNVVKHLGDVPMVLDHFQMVVDDYEEGTGDVGINDATKKTIMMQLLPHDPRKATCDMLMAARRSMAAVTPDYLSTIIVQRCDRICVVGLLAAIVAKNSPFPSDVTWGHNLMKGGWKDKHEHITRNTQ